MERQHLSLLTGLTRLHFEAEGQSAVGSALQPLAHLQDLRIAVHHRHELFLVLHPTVEYGALAQLTTLTSLELSNLAAYSFTRMPGIDWTDQPPPAETAARLLAALPALRRLVLRIAFCRMPGAEAGPEDAMAAPLVLPDGRRFAASLQRVPVQRPGQRRPAEWYAAWWVPEVQDMVAGRLGQDCIPLQTLRRHLHETSGWVGLNSANCQTYDVLARWEAC